MPVLLIPADNQSDSGLGGWGDCRFRESQKRIAQRVARDWLAARSAESDPGPAMARYRAPDRQAARVRRGPLRLARLLERSGRSPKPPAIIVWQGTWTGFPSECRTSFRDAYRRVAERHACILIDGSADCGHSAHTAYWAIS